MLLNTNIHFHTYHAVVYRVYQYFDVGRMVDESGLKPIQPPESALVLNGICNVQVVRKFNRNTKT